MIATFVTESMLLIYTLIRYKMNALTWLIGATLALLAIFQLAEYQVCGRGSSVSAASRIGYMAITMLPPISIHLVKIIAKKDLKYLVWTAYASGGAFALLFGLSKSAFAGYACAGNYAIFQLAPNLGGEYFVYYYFWLIVGILMSLHFTIDASKKTRQALIYQSFGVLSLLVPVGIVNALHPSTARGLPSIMCGFAVIYAIILVYGIAPFTLQPHKQVELSKSRDE